MLGKVLALSSLSAFVLLSALMQSTTPSTIHPIGILGIFVLFYVLALGVLTFFVYGLDKSIIRLGWVKSWRTAMSLKRAYVYGSVLALAPVMIVGTASIGRLGLYELALITVFEAVACFYVSRQS